MNGCYNQLQSLSAIVCFEIFERRKGLSTVMCTLYEQSEWHNRLGGNVQAESVIDRIVHNCVDIVLGDLNMRAYTSPTKRE